MKYKELAQLYDKLSSTTKRLEKIAILSDFLKNISSYDKEVLYLLLGDIYPQYDGRKIGISSQLAIKAIIKATGANKKEVIGEWKKIGDLGEVAEKLMDKKKQSTLAKYSLTTEKVLENLRKLPELEGKGTVEKKISLVTELLTSSEPIEAKYLVRTLLSDLRMGVQESTIRDSISKAFFNGEKESSRVIQAAIDKLNDLGEVFEISKRGKMKDLGKVTLQVGKPIKVMLAQKVNTIEEGFKALGKPCAIEFKYDGFRMLINKKGEKITLFTRRLENVTKQFPEVVEYVKRYVKGKSFILDTEAVGYDSKKKEYRPFQHVSQRIRRKYNIEELQKKLPVEINVFDLLYYNEKSLIEEPFKKRTELISKIVQNHPFRIIRSKQIITSNEKEAEEFYKKALKNNQEGIMMKKLGAKYQPGKRVGHMLKIKPEERDLDLVITGAEYGTGKRSGWLSSFILSCLDSKGGKYLEIGKVGTGFKEKKEQGISFEELTKKLERHIEKEEGKKVKIKPYLVVSVTYQEIQRSPKYSSGYALRFPRFTALRSDKHPRDVSTLDEIKRDLEMQKRNYRYG